jgi:glutathione S-transferase
MPLFSPKTSDDVRAERKAHLQKRYALVEAALARAPFILGDAFTVADAYLFVVTRWSDFVGLDLSQFPKLRAFQERIADRPSVKSAMRRETLVPV